MVQVLSYCDTVSTDQCMLVMITWACTGGGSFTTIEHGTHARSNKCFESNTWGPTNELQFGHHTQVLWIMGDLYNYILATICQ